MVQRAESFDETARLCGTSGMEVSKWYRRLETLGIDKVATVSALKDSNRFSFVQLGFFPESETYGFLFAPANSSTAQEELQALSGFPKHPGHRVDALDHGWFYYEGHWGPDGLPFSRVQ